MYRRPRHSNSNHIRDGTTDAAGNVSGNSNTASATTQASTGDTTPPSAPTSLSATAVSSSQINLSWSASTDNVGVTGYQVFRNGTQVGTPSGTSYSDTGLSASTAYSYTVKARDAAGNVSGNSNTASATTQGGGGGTITIGETTILPNGDGGNANLLLAQNATLSQTATIQSLSFYVTTAAGNLRLGIYDATGPSGGPGALKAQTASFAPVVGWNTRNAVTPVSLPAGTYWLAYLPSDNALGFVNGDTTGTSAKYYSRTFGALPATFSTSPNTTSLHWSLYATLTAGGGGDTTPPSAPTSLSATAVSSSQINLSWTASTDNVGVTGYKIFRGGTQIGTSATNSFSNTGLTASTNYSYYVTAYDAAGNNSAHTASATTQASGFAITVTQTSNGTITPGTTSVIPGGSQTFTITPNTNYNISSILADGANQTARSTWTDLGTQGGNTRIRAIVNVGGGVVVAGGETVIRSTNNGLTWTNLGALPGGVLVLELTYAGNNTVIAGTTNGRLFRSTDGGQTWTDLGTQYSQTHIYALKSLGNGVVLAGTQPGGLILRSTNYGATWTNLGKQGVETQIIVFANLGGNVVTQAAIPPPTVAITANPQSIGAGDSATLSWTSTGATSCTGTGFSTGGTTSGSAVVIPAASTLYSISCTGAGGTGTHSVTVTVGALAALPTIGFPSGTFTWTTANAVSCTASGGWSGAVATNGSYTFSTPVSTIYVLTCTGRGTTVQRTITITTSETATVSSKFQIGGSIATASTLNVRSAPSTSGTLLGTQPLGASGTVTGGPVQANGYWWWQVNYATGPDGWSVENWLQ